jgi:hypothetical protein
MSGNRPDVDSAQQSRPRTEPKRINVAVSPDMVRALENVIKREGITLTEALRRLVAHAKLSSSNALDAWAPGPPVAPAPVPAAREGSAGAPARR